MPLAALWARASESFACDVTQDIRHVMINADMPGAHPFSFCFLVITSIKTNAASAFGIGEAVARIARE